MATDLGLAQQFLAGFSTEEVCLHRPQHVGLTCKDIVKYMLKEETKMTAKLSAHSGALVAVNELAIMTSK